MEKKYYRLDQRNGQIYKSRDDMELNVWYKDYERAEAARKNLLDKYEDRVKRRWRTTIEEDAHSLYTRDDESIVLFAYGGIMEDIVIEIEEFDIMDYMISV